MARLTDEERAQLKALQDRAKAEDDEDREFKVRARNAKGIEVEYSGSAARRFLARHGFEDDEPEDEGDEDEPEDEEPDPAPAGGEGYFRKRKA